LSRQHCALLAPAALAVGGGTGLLGGSHLPEAAADLAAGLALLTGGAAAWARRPRTRSGPVLMLAGATWFAGDLSGALVYAHRGPLVHVLLSYPGGRVRSRGVVHGQRRRRGR